MLSPIPHEMPQCPQQQVLRRALAPGIHLGHPSASCIVYSASLSLSVPVCHQDSPFCLKLLDSVVSEDLGPTPALTRKYSHKPRCPGWSHPDPTQSCDALALTQHFSF